MYSTSCSSNANAPTNCSHGIPSGNTFQIDVTSAFQEFESHCSIGGNVMDYLGIFLGQIRYEKNIGFFLAISYHHSFFPSGCVLLVVYEEANIIHDLTRVQPSARCSADRLIYY